MLAVFSDQTLDEASGLAASRRHPGVLWTIEDSGADAVLHATDSTGANLGAWSVTAATNQDWEAISLGPCPAGECLYIGDIGDNNARRDHVTIYRVPEPDPAASGRRTTRAEALRITYPDGPRDAEAMAVLPDTTLLLISKRDSAPHTYTVRPAAWHRQDVAQAAAGVPLPIPPGGIAMQVTDAALSPDAAKLAVRTYVAIFFFAMDGDHVLAARASAPCGIFGLEPQGEGISWLDAHRLVTASENNFGMRGGLGMVRCEP